MRFIIGNTDVEFIDTSDWQILRGLSSGGTREKRVLQDDNEDKWYFKRSERKPVKAGQPEKYYKYEFWSEIIAYQVGRSLGLDILRYDVGYSAGDIGCISREMDAAADEQLVEVGRYMTTYNPAFDPDNTKARKEYTFQLLEEAIGHFELQKYWPNFLTTLAFDAVLGNTDRHQENWAFVGVAYRNLGAAMESMGENKAERLRDLMRAMSDAAVADVDNYVRLLNEFQLRTIDLKRMAPIYDSGSSLAREINEERVLQLLKDENELRKYIERGSAEVHWFRQKTSHFQLLFEYESNNENDPEAIQIFAGELSLGYIKKVHCRVFHQEEADKLELAVKAIEQNGLIRKIFVRVAHKDLNLQPVL